MSGGCLMIASMDVDCEHEALFHEVYDSEHLPNLMSVPGVLDVVRMTPIPFHMSIGGLEREFPVPAGEPQYSAVYRLESPHVLKSAAFGQAVEAGRWPLEVRPFTKNRRHILLQPMAG